MTEIDKDLQRRLQSFADGISAEPGRAAAVVRRARGKRRLVALSAGLAAMVAVGGLAGAATLLGGRDGIGPGPGSEERSECVSAGYDLAVFIPEQDFHDKMVEIEEHLRRHDAVTSVAFVSAADAMQEYLRENPDHSGPPPTQARRSQYRITLQAGVDPHRISGELADVGDGAFVPALDCPPQEPQMKFARYFFDVAKGNASAAGLLEVNYEDLSLCLQLTSKNITASHLLMDEPGLPGERIVLTFFDPSDDEVGPDLPVNGPHCFHEEQLGFELQPLLDEPELFRIDFHRGPNDSPGLVAELVPQGIDEVCARGPAVTDIPSGTVAPGERVSFSGRCFQDRRLHRKTKVFVTATVDKTGRPIGKTDPRTERTCELIAEPESGVRIFQDGEMRGWLIVPHNGTCFGDQWARTHLSLGAGTYQLALGCRACAYANLRVDPPATSSAIARVRTLVRAFMRERVEGAGAEQFLDADGRAAFEAGGDLAPLYPDPPLQDFQIEFVDDLGDGTYEVGVSLEFQAGSYGETLFVHERKGELVISGGRPGLVGS